MELRYGTSVARPDKADETASAFASARRHARAMADFPGTLPGDPDEAYAIQRRAIALWPDRIAGWKVGRMSPDLAARFGVDRFIGPIFAATVQRSGGSAPVAFPVFAGGFAAFEAEFVVILAMDAPVDKQDWTAAEAAALVAALHIGVEVAGSPLASINDLGSLATIAGYANNAGQIIGPAVPDRRARDLGALICASSIDGVLVGQSSAATLPGGPMAALAFALNQAARLGLPLKAGDFVSTGAITGVHPVGIGQGCVADFGDLGVIACVTEAIACPDH